MQNRMFAVMTALLIMIMVSGSAMCAEEDCDRCHQDIVANFSTSLHHTGAGMFEEYDKYAAGHLGIEMTEYYDKWRCNKCHVESCTQCHPGQNTYAVHVNDVTMDVCEPCHGKKQSSTFVGDMPGHKSQGPNADIHYERGMTCMDCHSADEIHGTGVEHSTQLEATVVRCEGCHKEVSESRSHTIHEDTLDCISCHTGWQLTCEGCHLDTRKGSKATSDKFLLGIGADGKVTTFLDMKAVSGNGTHQGYGEWNSHTTTAKGKDCTYCHENPMVLGQGLSGEIIGEGGSLFTQDMIDRVLAADISKPKPEAPGFFARILRIFGM